MGRSTPSRSGMKFDHLTENLGMASSMLCLLDSHANPSVKQDNNEEQKTTETSGPTPQGLLAKYDLELCCWRTLPDCFGCTEELSSATLPAWGMTVGGELSQRERPERDISASDGGAWPTPTASDRKGGGKGSIRKDTGKRREDRLDHLLEPGHQGKLSPAWVEWLMGWPVGWTSLDPLPEGTMEAWEASVKAGTYWDTDPADTGDVPRLTDTKENRVSRLKAIGNGQVPAQVLLALEALQQGGGVNG